MRVHITLDAEMVAELDRRAGKRRRSSFIEALVKQALEDAQRWDDIESALGAIPDSGHDWDEDPAQWVRAQRSDDSLRVG